MNKNKQIVILTVVIILIAFAAFFFIKKSNFNNVNQKQEGISSVSSPIVGTVELDPIGQPKNASQEFAPKKIFEVGSELETDFTRLPTGEWINLETNDYIVDYGNYYAFGNSTVKKEAAELVRMQKIYSSMSGCGEKSIACDDRTRVSQRGNDAFSKRMYDSLIKQLLDEKLQREGYRQY